MIRVGKIVATHGLQGAVIATHIVGNSKWLKAGNVLFVEMRKESYIPYFVSQVNSAGNEEANLNLEDVATVEEAKKLVGRNVYVESSVLEKHAMDSPLAWIGFKLEDKKHGNLGEIEDVMQTTAQWLARITYNDSEVLIPLIEQTIKKIDIKAKVIYIDLPEGLLEVYTGSEKS